MNAKTKIYSLVAFLLLSFTGVQAQSLDDVELGKVRIKFKQEFESEKLSVMSSARTSSESSFASVNDVAFESVSQQFNITIFKRVFPFSAKHEAKHRKHGLHLWYEVQFSTEQDPMEVVEAYSALSGVDVAKPIYKKVLPNSTSAITYVKAKTLNTASTLTAETFNDPMLADQWHYENDGLRVGENDADIDLEAAWEIQTGSPKVIVAIVDGGIDVAHEDLKDNLWMNEAELNGEEGVDDDGNGYVDDFHGYNFKSNGQVTGASHGTHVAGTVGAVNNNGIGVAGVAGGNGADSSGVSLMSCQIFEESGSSGGAAAAYVYAADNGAVIAQSSWGYTSPGHFEQDVQDAIAYFRAEAGNEEDFPNSPMVGGLAIFAAGNNGQNELHYPAAFENVMAVTSLGPSNLPAPYSNHGTWTEIAAPGGDQVNFAEIGGVLSTVPGNEYAYMQGTSMACPHVSGVAALILSEYPADNITPEDLMNRLMESATPFSSDMNPYYNGLMGVGILNARAALQNDAKIPPTDFTDFRIENIYHTSLDLVWTVPTDEDDESPSYYNLWLSNEEIIDEYLDLVPPYEIQNTILAGEEAILSIGGLRKQTEYYFAIQAVDRWGNKNSISYVNATTLDEPHFSFSPKNITLDIDVTSQKIHEEFVTITNSGEAALQWASSVENLGEIIAEELIEEEEEDETEEEVLSLYENGPRLKTLNVGHSELNFAGVFDVNGQIGYANTSNEVGSVGGISVSASEIKTDTLIDQTEYVAGLLHDNEYDNNYYDFAVYESSKNIGFSSATRFQIPLDYRFPLTHVEAVMWVEKDMKDPFIIEICKGGDEPVDLETIYAQPYYPRSALTDGWAWHKMSLAKPIELESNDIIWVKIHHPKEPETYLATIRTGAFPGGNFYTSHDGGRTYQYSSIELPLGGYLIPKVRVASTGEDATYLYIDPISGEVAGGSSENVRLVVDATNLKDGGHATAAAIYTNDANFPIGAVMVDVNVTGQVAEAKYEPNQSVGSLYTAVANTVKVRVENSGLADLEIYGLESVHSEILSTVANRDTAVVEPNLYTELEVTITPSESGVFDKEAYIKTNVGDLMVFFKAAVTDPPIATLAPSMISASVNENETTTVDFTISNDGAIPMNVSFPMDYSSTNKRITYTEDHSNAGAFEDISAFGISLRDSVLNAYTQEMPLGFDFPYFNDIFSYVNINSRGRIYFSAFTEPRYEWERENINRYPAEGGGLGTISVLEDFMQLTEDYLWKIPSEADAYCANLGNRFIVQYHNVKGNLRDEEEGRVTAQVVLFKDGAIEFRYDELQENSLADSALVGFQNLEGTVGYTLQERDAGRSIASHTSYRFVRETALPFVSAVSDDEFILQPSESKTITATLDPSTYELFDGKHRDFIFMETNTQKGFEQVVVDLTVNGFAELVDVGEDLLIDSVMIGKQDTAFFFIENTGTKAFEVTQLHANPTAFDVNVAVPFTVEAKEKKYIQVIYAANTVENFTETWQIITDVGQQSIDITAKSIPTPEPVVSLETSSFDLTTAETKTGRLTVENISSTEMEYTVYPSPLTRFSTDGLGVNTYTFRDSHEDAQVRYEWIEIAKNENLLTVPTDGYKKVEIPFTFNFYGQETNEIWVCENGYLTTVEPEVSSDPQYGPFREDDGTKGVVAPLWSYWKNNDADTESGIYLQADEERLIVEWKRVVNQYPGMPGYATFQAILHKNGQIKFQYELVDNYDGETWYGLKHINGKDIVDLGRPGHDWSELFKTPFNDYQAIVLTPAIDVVLAGNQSNTHDFVLDAERLASGTYLDTLLVKTNSTLVPEIEKEMTFNVTGIASMEVSEDSLNYGDVFFLERQSLRYKQTFEVSNQGTEVVTIDQIVLPALPDARLYLNETRLTFRSNGELLSPISIGLGEKHAFELEFKTEEVKTYADKLVLETSNNGQVELFVKASVVSPPVMNVVSEDYTDHLTTKDTLSHDFVIENNGAYPLTYLVRAGYEFVSNASTQSNTARSSVSQLAEEDSVDQKSSFDSLHYDVAETSHLSYSNLSSIPIRTAVRMTAPSYGFTISHVKAMVRYSEHAPIRVEIYDTSGEWPDDGNLIYREDINSSTSELNIGSLNWMTLELSEAVSIAGNEDFYLVITHLEFASAAYDDISDEEVLARNFLSIQPMVEGEPSDWFSGDPEHSAYDEAIDFVWKMRALSFQASWLELDPVEGVIEPGDSQTISASLLGSRMANGLNIGYATIVSDDPLNGTSQVNYVMTLNGAPEVTYSPDQYGEAVNVKENETKVVHLLAEDPEGDEITFELADSTFATIEQSASNQAKLTLKPSYDDQGEQEVKVSIKDVHGNETIHPIKVKVWNANRAPLTIDPWAINMTLEQPIAYTVKVADIFYDEDGDALQYGAVNDTPEILDVAYGGEEVAIIPKSAGVGVVYFLADDGSENGFTYTYLVVYVYSDGSSDDTSSASPSSFVVEPTLIDDGEVTMTFHTEARGIAKVEIISIEGQILRSYEQVLTDTDEQRFDYEISGLSSGIYLVRVSTAEGPIGVERIVVQ
ncbi:S8 family serine peptidase [Sediminitomix flava]|uniref:Putative secreted protein (Por secretion system target) n=1 Tax=Sediminitomix flava TaxID=379075 RepID=A0A316A4J3_SEDFL|nr:S8 family serine peptidase [Sediminitomix flava]PWJ44667.1 putative secreted protein (Por secretion system target) [Sediminitomix flava]